MTVAKTKLDLMDALPRFYDDAPEVDAIMQANAVEIDGIRQAARSITDQLYVRTATHGLEDWERVLGLSPRPNSSLSFRRNRILARLNGTAPATVKYLADVVNAHVADKSARIVEYNGEYRFEAEIPMENAIDTAAITRDISEVKPAHLAFSIAGISYGGAITIGDAYYDFGVPYRITNKFGTTQMEGRASRSSMLINCSDYLFNVAFPITNLLRTDVVNGAITNGGLSVRINTEQFAVERPLCGVLYATKEGVA